jgi:succinyl-diaminopimelate desuccinylase
LASVTNKQAVYKEILEKAEQKKDQLVRFTQDLVRIKSVNGINKEEDVARVLISKLNELDFELEVYEYVEGRPCIIATVRGNKPGPRLMCYSHMDTVPEWDASLWSADPFGAEVIDGKIYGRGTCDHKSEIVSLIVAYEILREMGTEFSGELVFIFDSDEENGGVFGMQQLMKNGLVTADLGLYACTTQISEESKPNFPTCGEVNIVHAATGIITYKFTVPGTKTHPRYLMNMEKSMTPGDHMISLLSKVNQLAEKVTQIHDERTGHAKLWVNSIETVSKVESARPGAMGVCEVTISRRVVPSEKMDQAEQDLLLLVEEIEKEKGIVIERELIRKRPYYVVPTDSRIIEEVVKGAEIVDGKKPRVTGVPALTGNGWFVNEGKIPTVMFGYGSMDFHHCIDEFIEISDIVKNTQAYAIIIKNILS